MATTGHESEAINVQGLKASLQKLKTDHIDGKAAKSNTTAGSYNKVTVNSQGIVTVGENPTTLAGHGITDAYTKTEVNGLVDTPHQEYVTVQATSQTTAATDVLPNSGQAADTIYRVSNWDGSANSGAGAFDVTKYSEYAWDGVSVPGKYVFLCVKSQIGEVFDISVYNNNAKYADLEAALGNDGANVPQSLRRGGMSVKFVQSSDNKYVQARLMANSFTTDTTQWQCFTSEIKAGSKDLVESGGVYDSVRDDIIGADVIEKTVSVTGTSPESAGIALKKDIKYVIYVQCSTAVDNSNTGVYVDAGSYTKIKTLTAAEFAAGSEFEYTPSADCWLNVRPYAEGSVAVKVWNMTDYLTLKQIESRVVDVENKAEFGSNTHIASYVAAFEEEDYVVTSTSADVKSTGVIPNQRIKVYIKSSELQRFAVYDAKNMSAGPIVEIPNGTDFSDGYTFEFACPKTMVANQYGQYQIVFRTWLATTLDNFNCYRLEPNPSTEDTVIKNKVHNLEAFKTNISSADVIAAIAGENLKFNNIQYDSDGKILSSGINWPDGGSGVMTIHYNGDIIDYIDYTKVEGTLGNTGTYRQSIVYYSDGNVQGNQITKIA